MRDFLDMISELTSSIPSTPHPHEGQELLGSQLINLTNALAEKLHLASASPPVQSAWNKEDEEELNGT